LRHVNPLSPLQVPSLEVFAPKATAGERTTRVNVESFILSDGAGLKWPQQMFRNLLLEEMRMRKQKATKESIYPPYVSYPSWTKLVRNLFRQARLSPTEHTIHVLRYPYLGISPTKGIRPLYPCSQNRDLIFEVHRISETEFVCDVVSNGGSRHW
jgi:hypothetical protein